MQKAQQYIDPISGRWGKNKKKNDKSEEPSAEAGVTGGAVNLTIHSPPVVSTHHRGPGSCSRRQFLWHSFPPGKWLEVSKQSSLHNSCSAKCTLSSKFTSQGIKWHSQHLHTTQVPTFVTTVPTFVTIVPTSATTHLTASVTNPWLHSTTTTVITDTNVNSVKPEAC